MTANEVKHMNCPNCNSPCEAHYQFCTRCGTRLTEAPIVPKPKRGTHWIPILIMAVLSLIGLGIYFATAEAPAVTGKPNLPSLSDTPWFSIEDGYLSFDPELYNGSSEVEIPRQVNGQTVLYLADGCFENCTEITTVLLPNTVESIGDYAFFGCTSMRGIALPDSVTSIGEGAFYGCTELEAICIPGSVTEIGADAFDLCDNLWYIYYLGKHEQWTSLYVEFINIYTGVYCEEGSFYQGGDPD